MTLAAASPLDGRALPELVGKGPYACTELEPWRDRSFSLPPGDTRLTSIFEGQDAPEGALQNLQGAQVDWQEHPDWMDLLATNSPCHDVKLLERALYLERWAPHIETPRRLLDLGGGVGRFADWFLRRGCEVEIVDPDLRSLWSAVSFAAGKSGKLDVHWGTGEKLPALEPVDAALAVEVLCYVEDPDQVLQNLHEVLVPGGQLFASVEARWGWAASLDAAPGSLKHLFEDGVVNLPGDRWVKTYEGQEFESLLQANGFEVEFVRPTHYAASGPFELAAGAEDLETLLRWEERCSTHPATKLWNRAWTAFARKPA